MNEEMKDKRWNIYKRKVENEEGGKEKKEENK